MRSNGRWGRDGREFRIEVLRVGKRQGVERCRADAQMAARIQGYMGPPDEVTAHDAAPAATEASAANPVGYVFTWYAPDSEEVRSTFP
jgi:hypothetical protein